MPLEDILGYAGVILPIVMSVVLAARLIKHMGEEIRQMYLVALSFLIMFFYAGVGLSVIFVCYLTGLKNDSAQMIILLVLIVSFTVMADLLLKKIYKK